jgi:hypothetical protein
MLSKRFQDVKLLVAGVRPWANHYLVFVLMVCNLRQDTFIDYLIAFTGLWPWANHFTFFMLCSLG